MTVPPSQNHSICGNLTQLRSEPHPYGGAVQWGPDGSIRPVFSIFNAGRALSPPCRGGNGLPISAGRLGCRDELNPGAQRLMGYTENEIIGQHFSRFYTPEDKKPACRREHWRPPPRRKIRGGRLACPQGRFAFLGICRYGSNSSYSQAKSFGFTKITHDLTSIRKLTETRTNTPTPLQSQKLEAIGQLTGGIAHDFNNIMRRSLAVWNCCASAYPMIPDRYRCWKTRPKVRSAASP